MIEEVVGWVGSSLLVVSVLQPTLLRLRWMSIVASIALIAYNIMIASWPMLAMNVVLVAINVWYLARFYRTDTTRVPRRRVGRSPSR